MELPYTHKLNVVLMHGEMEITELVFKRRAVLDDIRDIQLSQLDLGENIAKLTSRLTATPPSVIKKMDMADVKAVGEVVQSFFQSSQPTGNEPAEY